MESGADLSQAEHAKEAFRGRDTGKVLAGLPECIHEAQKEDDGSARRMRAPHACIEGSEACFIFDPSLRTRGQCSNGWSAGEL